MRYQVRSQRSTTKGQNINHILLGQCDAYFGANFLFPIQRCWLDDNQGQLRLLPPKPFLASKMAELNVTLTQGWQWVAKTVFASGFNRFKPAGRNYDGINWQKLK